MIAKTMLLNLSLYVILFIFSYQGENQQTDIQSLTEDKKVVSKVNAMLEKLGGEQKWKSLKSIYINAVHYEDRLEKPYQSEIWRNLPSAQIKIVQKTDSFTSYRIINRDEGFSKRDGQEWNSISEPSLKWLLNWDTYLIYRTISRLAKKDTFEVQLKNENTLIISEQGNFHALIELNEKGFPYRYGVPSLEGDTTYTLYTEWEETNGLFHPKVSTNKSGSFRFETQTWKWSDEGYEDEFFSIER